MRVGEILLEHGWVDPDSLARALAVQAETGVRLCSLLIARGMVGFDHAARALGEQLEVPAVLQRHLEHRDPGLVTLLPAALARRVVALPIGRLGNGDLIICVRDPSRALHAALTRAIGEPLLLAVAPARPLEQLVMLAYTPAPSADFVLDVEVDLGPAADDLDFDITHEPLPAPDTSPASPIGDPRVAPPRTAPRPSPPLAVVIPVLAQAAMPRSALPSRHSVEGTIASFADVDELDWLLDVVMAYVATRWSSALLLEVRDGAALGRRGHGSQLTEASARAVTLPLSAPSIVQLAHDQRRLVHERPPDPGDAQALIAARLGQPEHPVAAVFSRGGAVVYALVVGDPRIDDPDDAAVDLARLAEAIDEALDRIG